MDNITTKRLCSRIDNAGCSGIIGGLGRMTLIEQIRDHIGRVEDLVFVW